jgi:sterol desaturase/sphingolipid hydroxylase (fatty acid hydroxylase superfamily)
VLSFYLLAIAVVVVLTGIEISRGAKLDNNRLINVQIWALRAALGFALFPLVALSMPVHLIDGRKLPFVLAFVIFLLAMDLGEYLFHRAQHSIPWLWKLHALHHSDPDMNATTTERHFWGDQFIKAVTIWPLAAFIVRPTAVVLLAYIFVSMWNYVAHSGLPLNFGKLSWLWNSPAYHRRHHSSLPEHYNSNYAALLPIWDVILGSYYRPDGMPPTGLDVRPDAIQALMWPMSADKRQSVR